MTKFIAYSETAEAKMGEAMAEVAAEAERLHEQLAYLDEKIADQGEVIDHLHTRMENQRKELGSLVFTLTKWQGRFKKTNASLIDAEATMAKAAALLRDGNPSKAAYELDYDLAERAAFKEKMRAQSNDR